MASFTFGVGNAQKVLRLPLYALGALVTLVTARTGRLWVFGSGIGVGEGALALYRVARERLGSDMRLVWLATSATELAAARELGLDAEPKSGWRGFWLTARAKVLVVTHGFGDVNRYATGGGFVVQLWHGIPLKRLHLDSPAALRLAFLPDHRIVRALVARAYRLAGRGIDLFPVASQYVAPRIASAFGVPNDRIVVTGDPRDDALLTRSHAKATEPRSPESPRRILYAPTWRDGEADPSIPDQGVWNAIAAWLDAHDAELFIRTHPLGKGDYGDGPLNSPRIHLHGSDAVVDITPELAGFDALITDYSSIAFDFSLVGAPIVFLAPDVESYAKHRGLYEPYRIFSGGRHVITWEHALAVLADRLAEHQEQPQQFGSHEAWLRNEYFDHLDGRATHRVLDEILARIGTSDLLAHESAPQDAAAAQLAAAAQPAAVTPISRPRVSGLALDGVSDIPSLKIVIEGAVDGARLEGHRARVDGVARTAKAITTAVFPLLVERWGDPGLALPSGEYRLTLQTGSPRAESPAAGSTAAGSPAAGSTTAGSTTAGSSRMLVDGDLPTELVHELFRASVHAEAGGLVLRVAAPLAPDERGRDAQRRLERSYRRSHPPLEDAVFLESFYGQTASDNPHGIDRALVELRPKLKRYWSVVDGSIAVPPGGIRIIEGSREWWRVRRTARVLIVNDWLRKRYRRRKGQRVLQTWHGTMLKRLALDRPAIGLRTKIAVRRERSRWDALLAQNEYSANIFRSAYDMRRPIWVEGYPRNDPLHLSNPERAARVSAVRHAVGAPESARVVLYAPTWRDDRKEMVDFIDLANFAGLLGDGRVLLVRGHSRTLRFGQDLAGDRLIDVTSYPSMTELLLIADVLVTDYSSTMFDFAGTGKPTVLFTPDISHYGTDLRGFYLDLAAAAPGLLVHDRDALLDAVLIADSGVPSGKEGGKSVTADPDTVARAEAWRSRFTSLDDGMAGERVVRRLIDEGWID